MNAPTPCTSIPAFGGDLVDDELRFGFRGDCATEVAHPTVGGEDDTVPSGLIPIRLPITER